MNLIECYNILNIYIDIYIYIYIYIYICIYIIIYIYIYIYIYIIYFKICRCNIKIIYINIINHLYNSKSFTLIMFMPQIMIFLYFIKMFTNIMYSISIHLLNTFVVYVTFSSIMFDFNKLLCYTILIILLFFLNLFHAI